MPSKRKLRERIAELEADKEFLNTCIKRHVETKDRIKGELVAANESWAKEKKRADDLLRQVQDARVAQEKLRDVLYPNLYPKVTPGIMPLGPGFNPFLPGVTPGIMWNSPPVVTAEVR